MGRTPGAKNKGGYEMSPEAIKQRQVAPIKQGYHSEKVKKLLDEMGFTDKELTLEVLKEKAPELVRDLELIERTAQTRSVILEMYKRTGDIGLNMLNHLRELEVKKMKLEDKFRGKEEELVLDKQYLQLMDLIRKINNDFSKLGLDKTKVMMEMDKRGDSDVIDIQGFEMDG